MSATLERFVTAFNVVSALLFAGGTALLGFTIPGIWTLQSDVGGIKATLGSIDKRLEGVDKKLDGLDDKIGQVAKRADAIDLRLAARDTDPATILAAIGLRPESQFVGVRIEDKVFALPRTEKAAAMLERTGATRGALAPSIYGFELGKIDESGHFVVFSTPVQFERPKVPTAR